MAPPHRAPQKQQPTEDQDMARQGCEEYFAFQGPLFQKTASLASAPGSLQPAATGMKTSFCLSGE